MSWDRTGLILDIFSQRAQSHIGKTQVELAQVRYRMSRLVRAWSHLVNALTKAGTYAADQLFATLDTTSRRVHLEGVGSIVVSDTVGFIRDLPHQLVEAFRATLDETIHADLILHVIDACSPVAQEQKAEVEAVLEEIGADDIPPELRS